ncbi:hypothetical protein BGZ54_005801, partial [Gamsiella multidivaricata]
MVDTKDSLRPLVIDNALNAQVFQILKKIRRKGWMKNDVFVGWLRMFDGDLSQPTFLLLDPAGAHNNIDMRDLRTNTPWKHLHIRRLPKNTTSVVQPLDEG